MNSLKTGVIIAFGLTVLYGVYLVINKPEPTPEAQAAADAVDELSIGVEGEEADSFTTAKDSTEPEATHEHDAPVEKVADRRKPDSRHDHEDRHEVLTKTKEVPPTTDEAAVTADSASDSGEVEERPWRKKPGESEASSDDKVEDASPVTEEKAEGAKEDLQEPVTEKEPVAEKSKEEPKSDRYAAKEKATEEVEAEVKIAPRVAPALGAAEFETAWTKMEAEIEAGKLKDALRTISPFYHSTDLPEDDHKQLLEVLDLLAWKVVFSKEHFLAKPHIVAAGETLEDIALKYQVPGEVIAKVNGIKSTKLLSAGDELKIVPGPFRAEVSPERGELTLFLDDLYATRYAIESGTEPPPEPGEYTVLQRANGSVYRTINNRDIPAQDSRNPYGGIFLDLGDGQCLHGSPEAEQGEALGTGCMRLRGKDAKEVYWLLSKGSKVTILR